MRQEGGKIYTRPRDHLYVYREEELAEYGYILHVMTTLGFRSVSRRCPPCLVLYYIDSVHCIDDILK